MRALRVLAAAGFTALATSVSAGPIVTTWDYNVTSFFSGATVFGTGGGPTLDATTGNCIGASTACASPTLLRWGVPQNPANAQSSLEITGNPATGQVTTHGVPPDSNTGVIGDPPTEIGITQTFIHSNFPISAPALTAGHVTTTLTLTPFLPAVGSPFGPVARTFDIFFLETPNEAGNCQIASVIPCRDIFAITGNFNFEFQYNYGNPGDTPETYFVQIFPIPLGGLIFDNAICASVGAPNGCASFSTEENQQTPLTFGFAITSQPFVVVPEPGILALFAMGLVGLGFSLRRRQA